MNKKSLIVVLAAIVVVTLGGFFFLKNKKTDTAPTAPSEQPSAPAQAATEGGNTMVIETAYGTVNIELFPKDAPKTVARIKELVNQGFYNGLTFHRVVPGFVVQGGDPRGDGTGGSGQNIPAEFNSRQHVEGTVAMARAADPNSADSQFYISLGRHPHLDGQYTIFGQVTSGMDAVKQIKVGDKMTKVSIK
jgi:cyclophilin family peptidyl-prolyl cis-trans isomerase